MDKLKYGLGKQDFASLRKRGFVYVDKTRFIAQLLEGADYYFLSRPRRFGKSLFISTLYHFFRGHKELFSGLAIESYPWDWQPYPVIRINLAEGSYSKPEGLMERLYEILGGNETFYEISPLGSDPRSRLRNLIIALRKKTGKEVVILIDEYEKPLLDAVNKPYFSRYQDELADFYSVLKSNEEMIRMLFISGVTRFGHLNIFSGFNNLTDISLDDRYSSICGITHAEMLHYLGAGIEVFAKAYKTDFDDAVAKLKEYYDGYHFSRELTDIYNPFSLLSCLDASRLTSTWFQSGSSRYLLERLRANRFDITRFDNIVVNEETLLGLEASMNDIVTLLYQSGYLTIKNYDLATSRYTLDIPNYEVSKALYSSIIPFYLGPKYNSPDNEAYTFIEKLEQGEAEEAMNWLQSYFSSIPYDVKLDYESEFQQVVYAFFALSGKLAGATLEKETSDGRIDLVYETGRYVYVFEFKRGEDATVALEQINSKQYALQWMSDKREVIKIGVAFSPETRGIAGFAIETN